MDALGVRPGQACQPHDRVAMHAGESFGLTNSVPFDQMMQNRKGRRLGQATVEQRSPFAFREAGLARVAVKEPDLLVFAVAVAD